MDSFDLTKWICLTVFLGSVYSARVCHDYSGFVFDEFTARVDCCVQDCRSQLGRKETKAACEHKCKREKLEVCSSECAFSDTTLEGGCKENCKLSRCQNICLLEPNQTACEDYCEHEGLAPKNDPCYSSGLTDQARCEEACIKRRGYRVSPCEAACRCLAPQLKEEKKKCRDECFVDPHDCSNILDALHEDLLANEKAVDMKYKSRFSVELNLTAKNCLIHYEYEEIVGDINRLLKKNKL